MDRCWDRPIKKEKAKMVKRTINVKRHMIVAALTISIFLLGLFLGLIIEGKRVMYIQDLNVEQKIEFSSLQLQFLDL